MWTANIGVKKYTVLASQCTKNRLAAGFCLNPLGDFTALARPRRWIEGDVGKRKNKKGEGKAKQGRKRGTREATKKKEGKRGKEGKRTERKKRADGRKGVTHFAPKVISKSWSTPMNVYFWSYPVLDLKTIDNHSVSIYYRNNNKTWVE